MGDFNNGVMGVMIMGGCLSVAAGQNRASFIGRMSTASSPACRKKRQGLRLLGMYLSDRLSLQGT